MKESLTYADAGVDIDKANAFVDTVKEIAKQTHRSGVMSEIGGFGGLFSLNTANLERPVLVSSTDGVGTKLKIAFATGIHDTDIIVQGAKPLFFLDYLAMGRLDTGVASDIVRGIGEGCRLAQCALIGGETAEMPGMYQENEYDLAGFVVGVVDNAKIPDGSEIRAGYKLIGIASSGLHSNGFSLVRKICFDVLKLKIDDYVPDLGKTLGEELLTPTRIYTETIQRLIKDLPILGLAHITGGGIVENVLRIIPQSFSVVLQRASWEVPPIFHFLQQAGNVSEGEMMRTFNNGIGMVLIVPDDYAQDVIDRLSGVDESAFVIGETAERREEEPRFLWADDAC